MDFFRGAALGLATGAVAAAVLAGPAVPASASSVRAGASSVRAGASSVRAGASSVPASYLAWYRAAARTCPGLTWEVLAGIGTMESDNGRSTARGVHRGKNRKGAEGPMQFEPATFTEYAVRADRARRLSPYDPADAIFTAARMLCADGAAGGSARGLRRAIFAYNHARWYVRDVLAIAGRYTAAAARGPHRHPHPRHQPRRRRRGAGRVELMALTSRGTLRPASVG